MAVRSAKIMGLKVAGVDMLEGRKGPQVIEINCSPGLEGIETATKLDVAGAIIDYIDNQVAFPDIDVRQRLGVSTGYGVAEIVVHSGSDMVGKKLGESGLDDRDITVLTLHRGTQVIPNPRNKTVLEGEDRLLCFGKLEEMRSMIPDRNRSACAADEEAPATGERVGAARRCSSPQLGRGRCGSAPRVEVRMSGSRRAALASADGGPFGAEGTAAIAAVVGQDQ